MTKSVVVWGMGAMGSAVAALIESRPELSLVGAIDSRRDLVGRDVGNVVGTAQFGVKISGDPSALLSETQPDCCIIATTSWLRDQLADLTLLARHKVNVISIAEEMTYPWAQSPELAENLNQQFQNQGVTCVGTGVNPGFSMDLLAIVLTAGTHHVERLRVRRVNDLSVYGETVLRSQGVGLTPDQFARGVIEGSVTGHVGFPESTGLISAALELHVDRIEESRRPIIAEEPRKSRGGIIPPGRVVGCHHVLRAFHHDSEVITLEHPQELQPHETGDHIEIIGRPTVTMSIEPEYPGKIATTGIAVNSVGPVVTARPGLLTMLDLPVPRGLFRPPL